ncbi:BTAD domain-containing putative transcriptional regulator [Nonomuraea monospora]|uniref:BTAD domain-containing putative transcriptional regulator n=1 Tax=Nonomuraea monospora TaxID=568818 RepID=A0ABP5PJL6_9ACTN
MPILFPAPPGKGADDLGQAPHFRLLGPVGIWQGDHRLGPAAAQQRTVLAMLLLEAGRPVPVDRLIMSLWGADPPSLARNAVQGCVSRIRRVLVSAGMGAPQAVLTTSPQGYCLAADRKTIDLHRFRDLVGLAGRCEPAKAHELLCSGLRLWRGAPLPDVAGSWLPDIVAPNLEEERLAALERRIALDLLLGRHWEIVDEVSALVADFPLRERLACLLLSAMHRCGRRVDALSTFQRVRKRFVEEFGIEPGEELQRAHRAILDGQEPPLEQALPPATPGVVPRQLPARVAHFTGRQAELAALDSLLPAGDEGPSRAVPVGVIIGTGGIGKTALAVHWAHQVADRFQDGHVYVDLRGFGPAARPLSPVEVLRILLGVLKVPDHQIPAAFQAQVGLYRSLLAGRRMLILLDNARDSSQVHHLLPTSPGCLTLVTSRVELTDLITVHGARRVSLTPFPDVQAGELLERCLGEEYVAAQRESVADVIRRCAGLPLALTILAARAAARPGFPLASLLPDLGLDAFDGGEPRSDVRSVFSWSYRALTPEAARLFRLLGLREGLEIDTAAAANLADVPVPRTRRLLAELHRTQLLNEAAPGRYTSHDLLWTYAREQAHAEDSPAERHAAFRRLLDHYLHAALNGNQRLQSYHRTPLTPPVTQSAVVPQTFADRRQALAWFRRERRTLLMTIRKAAAVNLDTHVWQLAYAMRLFLYQQGHFNDQVSVSRIALAAATRQADRAGQAHAHFGLGQAYVELMNTAAAHTHLLAAIDLYREVSDELGQANVHAFLGRLGADGDLDAISHAEQALALVRAAGHRAEEARCLNNIGWIHAQRGEHQQALRHCAEALAIQQELGHPGQAYSLDSLGYISLRLGHHEQAIGYYERALALFSDEQRFKQTETLLALADAQISAHHLAAALGTLRRARALLDELDPAGTMPLRTKLSELVTLAAVQGRRT